MASVPVELRTTIGGELDALVRGERPELLTWVREYGEAGATLIAQPDDIWTHERTEVSRMTHGGWHVVLPLWTVDESPSDLSAEVEASADGAVRLLDVHVL
jgi:hypothetical protein